MVAAFEMNKDELKILKSWGEDVREEWGLNDKGYELLDKIKKLLNLLV